MKAVSHLLIHLGIVGFVVAGLVNEPSRKGEPLSQELQNVSAVLSEVNPDSVLNLVRYLSGQKTRRFTSDGAAASVSFITRRLTALGLSVEHQFVEVNGTEGESVIVTNVLCSLNGGAPNSESLVFCAHYDSRAEGRSAPGADDNASGVAVLMEAARVLVTAGATTDVILIFFGGEEDGLLGSNGFAKALPAPNGFKGVINVDMVGYDRYGPKDIVVFANERSTDLAATIVENAHRYTQLRVETLATEFGNSDHMSFWKYGHAAVSIWEGFDHNPFHHTDMDLPDNLVPAFLVEVTRLVLSVAVAGGSGEAPHSRVDERPKVH